MDDVMDRRRFLQASIATGVVASSAPVLSLAGTVAVPRAAAPDSNEMFRWSEATIADLQAAMASGETSALELTRAYLARIEAIDWSGPRINSIIEVNPDAEVIASALDVERAAGHI